MRRMCSWIALTVVTVSVACKRDVSDTPSATAAKDPAPVTTTDKAGFPAVVPDFAVLAERAMPAVVSIQVEQHVKPGDADADPLDFFRFFGGGAVPREYENRALGSGFVIEPTGVILTNHHVVDRADSIEVTFSLPDGSERRVSAKVLGAAPDYDVALIKTETDVQAATLPLGDSDAMRIGNWVMAVGNPFGLDHSVSVGIISAKQRRDIEPSGHKGLYDFLQTDASINPGNSGGPLINLRGDVIGINSAINAQGQGIGFAIPINMVKEMLPQLEKGGHFTRSWIGIKIQPLTHELAQSYGLGDSHGVLVSDVVKGGPGAQAGIEDGDVILEFDGKKLHRTSDLTLLTSMAGVGKSVPIKIWRDKVEKSLTVKLEAFPDQGTDDSDDEGDKDGDDDGEVRPGLGLVLMEVTARMRAQHLFGNNSQHIQGAFVDGVEPGSVAARAGVRRGDLIIDVNDQSVARVADVVRRVRAAKSGEVLRVKVQRQGSKNYLAIRKP